MNRRNKKFQFPKHILNQIDECSMGFLLFYINNEGDIVPIISAQNQITHTGLIAFAEKFIAALGHAEMENLVNSFRPPEEESEGFSDSVEEDDEEE